MKLHLLLILGIFLFSQYSLAAYVERVKNKKALIFLDGMQVNKGDMVNVVDPSTKKTTAVLRITTVKDNKAIGQVVRGNAKANHTVVQRKARAQKAKAAPRAVEKKRATKASNSTIAFGGLLGMSMDSMEIVIPDVPPETVKKSGNGMSLLGAVDMKLRNWLSLRGLFGIEQFKVEADGAASCGTCEVSITYFNVVGWARYHFTENLWGGFGLGLQHPLSKKTHMNLDESSVKTSTVYGFAGGYDLPIGVDKYIPIQVEYGMQPKSEAVSMSYIGIRAGLMLRF